VRYSFDNDRIETGPDTFAVFEKAQGSVALATAYRTSGYHSVAIREAAGDGDFAELQGYFAARRQGTLYVHFAFLVADPRQELNIALAGPAGFRLGKDGIAVWLTTRGGMLAHVSDSITHRLFPLERFTWYRVDLAYDIDRGTYDLSVAEELQLEQRVHLRDQPNAASQAGSAVDKFSFIGDLVDASEVRYFVDDVVIGTDAAVEQLPFIAPGRRTLFTEITLAAQERMRERIACLPALGPDDFGINAEAARSFAAHRTALAAALAGAEPPAVPPGPGAAGHQTEDQRLLGAIALWVQGCRALAAGAASTALNRFDAAAARAPEAPLYAASAVLALAAAGRSHEAETRWNALERAWRHDPRTPVMLALLGRARGDPDQAERWLRAEAERAAVNGGPLSSAEKRVAEEYFHALLWSDRLDAAERYAHAMARRATTDPARAAVWWEHAGDAALYRDDLDTATRRYERAARLAPERASVLLKLSDLHYAAGDLERERLYREKIFGTLRP
jgi:tetratricopeptide (TPR) repeat protein